VYLNVDTLSYVSPFKQGFRARQDITLRSFADNSLILISDTQIIAQLRSNIYTFREMRSFFLSYV